MKINHKKLLKSVLPDELKARITSGDTIRPSGIALANRAYDMLLRIGVCLDVDEHLKLAKIFNKIYK